MGTIVATRTNQGLAIGADCLNTLEELIHSSLNQADSCISKLGESYIGLNCSYALQQLSQSVFTYLSSETTSEINLSNRDQIRSFFSSHYSHLRTQHHVIPQQNPNFPFETLPLNALVVNRHGIFKIDAARSVYEHKKFWAIGSGEAFALGALHALYNEDADPEQLIRAALKACGTFEANRGREVIIKTIKLPNLKLAPPERQKDSSDKAKLLMHRGPISIRRGKRSKKKEPESEQQ